MTRTTTITLLAAMSLLLPARPAAAWSNKEHIQLARIAAIESAVGALAIAGS